MYLHELGEDADGDTTAAPAGAGESDGPAGGGAGSSLQNGSATSGELPLSAEEKLEKLLQRARAADEKLDGLMEASQNPFASRNVR